MPPGITSPAASQRRLRCDEAVPRREAASMTSTANRRALEVAVTAARAAGKLMRANLNASKKIKEATRHDIKLELDVRCQKLIERTLRRKFPKIPILGEEGILGNPEAPVRWVCDPIDGTV